MILDTCASLWLASGTKRLSKPTLKRLNEGATVYVSAISGFEIALKVGKGDLTLPHSPEEWFNRVMEEHGLMVLPIDLSVCVTAAQLPPIHVDPCDRFIIASAKLHDLSVVTADERFLAYGVSVVC